MTQDSTLIPGAMTGEDLIAWFDNEAPRMVEEAKAQTSVTIPFSTSDGSDLWFAPAADTALTVPDDAPAWLDGFDFHNNEEFEQAVVDLTGKTREAQWLQADMFAAAWLRVSRGQRRALLKRLGHLIGRGEKTAERRVKFGLRYPPDIRDYTRPLSVYDAALKAADPCEVMEAALRFGWSAKEVREHIDTGQAPTHREKLVAEDYPADADAEDVAALVHRAIHLAQTEPHSEHGRLLELRVSVSAVYAASEAEREAA